MSESLITRRDFGRLALIGASSLLLADGLVLAPKTAHAATATSLEDVKRMQTSKATALINKSKIASDNARVQFNDSDFDMFEERVVYVGPKANETRRYTRPFTVTYTDAAVTPDGVYDVRLTFEDLEIVKSESNDYRQLWYENGYQVFQTWGWFTGDLRTGGFVLDGNGVPCLRTRVRYDIVDDAGNVVDVSFMALFRDIDTPDNRYDDTWEPSKIQSYYYPPNRYSESIEFISGVVSGPYVAADTWLKTDGGRFHGSQFADGEWQSGVAAELRSGAVIEWRGGGCATEIGVAIDDFDVYEDVPWTPTATKVLDLGLKSGESTSRRLQANEFTFELRDESGRLLQTKKNATDGSVKFDAINLGTTTSMWDARTATYTVTEVAGADSSLDYDDHTLTFTVTLNPDGSVSESVSGSKTFTNVYRPEGRIAVKKSVSDPRIVQS